MVVDTEAEEGIEVDGEVGRTRGMAKLVLSPLNLHFRAWSTEMELRTGWVERTMEGLEVKENEESPATDD